MIDWKSPDDQLHTLESLGMNIGDRNKAKEVLRRVGYFRFSGYSYPFRKKLKSGELSEHFVEGTKLSEINRLYVFDKKLKLLCSDAIERIEVALRADISNELGQIDAWAHVNVLNFDPRRADTSKQNAPTNFEYWHNKHSLAIDDKRGSKRFSFVKTYVNENNELPVWVAMEICDFGSLAYLFKMMKKVQCNKIAANYNLSNGITLENWIFSIGKIRNISAHHERLWNTTIPRPAPLPNEPNNEYIANIRSAGNERVFHYLCIMQFLLITICPNSGWGARLRDHLLAFPTPENGKVTIESMGVANDWEGWTLWDPNGKSPLTATISRKEKLADLLFLRKSA